MGFELTKEQQDNIRRARSSAQNLIRKEIEEYYKNINNLLERDKGDKDYSWWNKIMSPIGSGLKGLIDGSLQGVVGFGQTFNVIATQLVNDIAHIIDPEKHDGTNGLEDIGYMFGNLGATVFESLGSFAVSTTANFGRIYETTNYAMADLYDKFGWNNMADKTREVGDWFDPEWAFGEGKVIDQIEEIADVTRNMAKGESFQEAVINPEEDVEDHYYKKTQEHLANSVGIQNWVEENVTDAVSNAILGKSEENAQALYGDNKWFQTWKGVTESMGNILAMWGIAKIAKAKMNNPSPAQVKAVSNTYFASSVFGKMYQEAINNGSGYNDAFTYATGQAMMETLIEQTGGFKGADGADALTIWKRLQDKGWAGVLKNSFEEGMEEIYSEYGGTGYETYNKGIEDIDNSEFYSNAMFSFLSGASSSALLGFGRNAYFNLTADSKSADFHKALKEEGIGKANKKLNAIADQLSHNARGITVNDKGVSQIKKMNQEEKRAFIKRNKLSQFFTEDENGNFIAQELTEDMFENRIGDETVEKGKYAINDNVRGMDITDDGNANVIEQSKLDAKGKKALKIADEMDIPIAIYESEDNDSGFYGDNGVLYINQKNLENFGVEKTIIKHELIHAIKQTDSKLYEEIEDAVKDFVELSATKNGELHFEYKNDTIKELFRSQGIESKISNSALEYLKETNSAEQAMFDAQEEVTAYFIQNLISDNQVLDVLSKEKKGLLQRIADSFAKNEEIDDRFEGERIARQIKQIKRKFESGAKRVVNNKKSVGYIIRTNAKTKLIKQFKEQIAEQEIEYEKQVNDLADAIIKFGEAYDWYAFTDEISTPEELEQYKKDLVDPEDENLNRLFSEVIAVEEAYDELVEEDSVTDDIKEAYDNFQEKMESLNNYANKEKPKVEAVKKSKAKITDHDRAQIRKIFSDDMLEEFFEIKRGKYVLKNDRVTAQTNKQNVVTIDGVKYRSTEYGVNAYNGIGDFNIAKPPKSNIAKIEPLKINDMTMAEHMMHEFFSTTKLNYVLYRGGTGSTVGFSSTWLKANVVFINTEILSSYGDDIAQAGTALAKVANTMIHEHLHEAFKYSTIKSLDYASMFADVMFKDKYDSKGKVTGKEPTEVWKEFDKQYSNGFLLYFQDNYGKKKGFTNVKTVQSVYNLLSQANSLLFRDSRYNSINEITAQITGRIFSNEKIYRQVLDGKSTTKYKMFELYDKIMNNSNLSANVKTYLETALKGYKDLFDHYMNEVKIMFPQKKKYTLKELNQFIRSFTDGKYTTKRALLLDYMKEKADKKRDVASITVDNIIYLASLLPSKIESAVQSFTQLEADFKKYRKSILSLLNERDMILRIPHMFTLRRKIYTKTYRILQTYNGKKYKKEVYTDEYALNKLLEDLDIFEDEYLLLSDEIIDIFNLPSQQVVHDTLLQMEEAINDLINQIHSNAVTLNGLKIEGTPNDLSKFAIAIENMKNKLDKLNKRKRDTDAMEMQFLDMHTRIRRANTKNLLNAIHRSVKNAKQTMLAVKRSKESKPNQDYLAVYGGYVDEQGRRHEGIINRITDSINKNFTKHDVMKKEVGALLDELRSLIQTSNVVGADILTSVDSNDSETTEALKGEVALLKDELVNERLLEVYEQFAFLFKDKDFVQSRYNKNIYNSLEIDEIVKEFNETKIASNLANILKQFQTTFETVFRDGMSLEAYAKQNHDQIASLDKKYDFSSLRSKLARGMTPQDILLTYQEVTEGEIAFFEDFFREYLKAVHKKEKIMADFSRVSDDWHKAHKNATENSTEEIEIDTGYLVEMDVTEIDAIKEEAKEKIADINNKIKELKKKRDALRLLKRKLINDIEDETKIKRRSHKLDQDWKDANARAKALKDKKDKIYKEEKDKTQLIKELKDEKRLYDEDLLIKQAVSKLAKRSDTQKIQRGHVISLYLSVMREIEMQKMADNGNTELQPTDHFAFANQIQTLDNALLEQKGYKHAIARSKSYTIFSMDKQQFANYLEGLLTKEDRQIIDFAKSIFDQNYDHVNPMYKAKYKVDLTKQPTYIPFSTTNANVSREMKLKLINRNNIGVDKGFIMKTTLGSKEDLRIENIFSVLGNHTRSVANYSYDRLNTDYQNLLVNKAGYSTFQSLLNNKNGKFGVENDIENNLNQMLTNMLQYSDLTESEVAKKIRRTLRRTVKATIGLAVPMYFKQYFSMFTIYFKQRAKLGDPNRLSLAEISWGVVSSPNLKIGNKYYKWLMDNNNNFYFRSKLNFMPNLAENVPIEMFGYQNKTLRKIFSNAGKVVDATTAHVGRADARVLVGAFKSKVKRLMKKQNLSEEEAMEKANEWLNNEVLLYSVANTANGLRSTLSNSQNIIEMMFGKFQSENIIHFSSLVRDVVLAKNKGLRSQLPMFGRDMLAFLISGFFSAIVSKLWEELMGYNQDVPEDKETIDFLVNQFLLENIVGSIPYVNQFTQQMKIDFDVSESHPLGGNLDTNFDIKLPLLDDVRQLLDDMTKIVDRDGNIDYRRVYESVEELGYMFGVPIKNAEKIARGLANIIQKRGTEEVRNFDRLVNNQSKTEAYYQSIENGNQREIEGYVSDQFKNIAIKNEIVGLMVRNPEERIKIYDVETFRSLQDDGTYDLVAVPDTVKTKYQGLTQRALSRLINQSDYRRLSDEHKIKTIQRVINYYYNHMKAVILKDYNKIRDYREVVETSIQYAYRET